jgi:uncharacterized membrane protein
LFCHFYSAENTVTVLAFPYSSDAPLRWPTFLLGFSLGGFFDGILLHQILQWHHLLSGVAAVQDVRAQVLADGLFHALMYFVAAVALIKLWRRRAAFAAPRADWALCGHALVGFGCWHIVDGVFSHWVTGIHRIRSNAASPLLWDVLWFFVFGVVPVVLGLWMLRKARAVGGRHGRGAATMLGLATLLLGPIAALPVRDAAAPDQVMVMFAPGVGAATAFNALARVDARVLWVDRSGSVWAISMSNPSEAWKLFADGAVLVSNSAVALGCFSWTQVSTGRGGQPRPAADQGS